MTHAKTKRPRSVCQHRRGLIPTHQERTDLVTQPTATAFADPNDDFNGIVEQLNTTSWGATVNLTLEPLRPHEIEQRTAYIEAVPGTSPWGPFVQVYVLPNGLISIARMDNPQHGWVMTADENDALMAAQREAGRRARSNTPAPPDAA